MTDLVYPLGSGSIYSNFELRMSMRSVETHLSGVRNIYIIGIKPDWIQNVIHIQKADTTRVPDLNIMRKVEVACRHSDVSDNFLFMNDDHYINQDFKAADFPYYYSRTMKDYLLHRNADTYRQRVKNSYEYLISAGLPTRFFDCHFPIVYNKSAFIEHVVNKLNWKDQTSRNGFVLKSVYANAMKIEGIKERDHKGGQYPPSKQAPAFSSTPHMRACYRRMLSEKWPKKSIFEGDNPGF